jgi:hypothetical protein
MTASRRRAVQLTAAVLSLGSLALMTVGGPSSGDEAEPAGTTFVPAPEIPLPTGVEESSAAGQPQLFRDVSRAAGVAGPTGTARLDEIPLPGDLDHPEAVVAATGIWTRLMVSESYFVSGQAWGDYDRDGFLDLYVTDQAGPNRLLRNQRDGTFAPADAAADVALGDEASGGAVWVDYDNDGWVDLHVLGDGPDHLFRNERGTGFTDVTEEAGIDDPGQGQTAAWADVNGDAHLDVYVVDYGCQPCVRELPVPEAERDQHHLFLNDGDGTFTDITGSIDDIPGTRALGFGATWSDFDLDGDPDLYVVNDVRNDRADHEVEAGQDFGDGTTPGNLLLRNDGPGCGGWCFSDVSAEAGVDVRGNAMGVAVGDTDNDGDPDVFFSNSGWRAGPTVLLRNDGDGGFTDVSEASGANVGEWSWGTSFLDVDNDGLLDAFLGVGYSELLYQAEARALEEADFENPDPAREQVAERELPLDVLAELPSDTPWPTAEDAHARTDNNRVLLQQADGTFRVVVVGRPDRLAPVHYGTAVGDYDNDGWPDVVVGKLTDGYALLRNIVGDGSAAGRIVFDVRGDGEVVNRDGVGARVTVTDDSGRRQVREVQLGGSLGSGNDRRLMFGLGDAQPEAVEVWWPDGTTQRIDAEVANRLVTVTYGGEVTTEPLA